MNIGHINPRLIYAKSVFAIIFHSNVSVSKAARIEISSIDSDKNIIFVFQVNFYNVFRFVMEFVP